MIKQGIWICIIHCIVVFYNYSAEQHIIKAHIGMTLNEVSLPAIMQRYTNSSDRAHMLFLTDTKHNVERDISHKFGMQAVSFNSAGLHLQKNSDETKIPTPYSYNEFPRILHMLYRFEVITVGAFPLAYVLTNALFLLGRFVWVSIADGADAGAALSPFGTTMNLNTDETTGVLLASIGVSVVVGIIDMILNKYIDEESYLKSF